MIDRIPSINSSHVCHCRVTPEHTPPATTHRIPPRFTLVPVLAGPEHLVSAACSVPGDRWSAHSRVLVAVHSNRHSCLLVNGTSPKIFPFPYPPLPLPPFSPLPLPLPLPPLPPPPIDVRCYPLRGCCFECRLEEMEPAEISAEVVRLLSAVQQTGGRFGLCMPIDVLRGSGAAKLTSKGFDTLPSFGTGHHRSLGSLSLALGSLLTQVCGVVESSGCSLAGAAPR